MTLDDEMLIRRAVDEWVIWRDMGDWDRFLALWHPRGRMITTWFDGPVQDFVARSRETFGKGAWAHHFLGGGSVRIAGARAVANSRMTLHLRTTVEGVLCDITCLGRFVDLMIREDGRWMFAVRQPVYEKDWLAPSTPESPPRLDAALLAGFPGGYRHLAYAQARVGMTVDRTLPCSEGEAADKLKNRVEAWLDGTSLEGFLT